MGRQTVLAMGVRARAKRVDRDVCWRAVEEPLCCDYLKAVYCSGKFVAWRSGSDPEPRKECSPLDLLLWRLAEMRNHASFQPPRRMIIRW
jgi:hypothetical protein